MQQTELERISLVIMKLYKVAVGLLRQSRISNIYGHQIKEWVIKIGCNSCN